VARRWVRYQLPVMVLVDISETEEHEQVTKVVLGIEADDLHLDRDLDGHFLIYDENMERVSADEHSSRQALQAADRSQWPDRQEWEEGPDALRDRWLYEDGDVDQDDLGEGEGEEIAATIDAGRGATGPT
jgi:hypothetical protein